jgi:hypothetical protein
MSKNKKDKTDSFYSGMFPKRRGNCFAFAINRKSNVNDFKLQPGNISRTNGDPSRSCGSLSAMLAADSKTGKPTIKRLQGGGSCGKGFRKIAGVVDPGKDYHFYRQLGGATVHAPRTATIASVSKKYGVSASKVTKKSTGVFVIKDKVWAHKRGLATGAIMTDARGKVVRDPRTANRSYGDLKYSNFCGFWCVSKKDARK